MRDSKFGWTRGLSLFGLVAVVLAIAPTSSAQQCISSQAEKNLSECPGGKLATSGGKKPEVSFSSAPQSVSLKKKDAMKKPKNPSASMNAAQRDERRQQMADKSRQLLVTEIQGLESLFSSTPKKAKDRPKLMRRLAEGYVELENAAFRDMTEADIKMGEAKQKNKPEIFKKFKEEKKKAAKILKAARKRAIKYYLALAKSYPKWCQNPNPSDPSKSSGCGDEVLYYLAYEYEQMKDYDKARKVYYELIQDWPNSKFIPNAYLAFGELFFQEAQGDPGKWTFAEQSYQEVIKYPPPDNKVFGYAHYKLGYVYWNQEDFAKAMSSFKQTIDYGMQYSNLPNAAPLAKAARRDIIPVYALSGDPKAAYNFFKPISGDKGGSNEKTFEMMYDLGMNYLDTGGYPEGIALFEDLKRRDPGERACEYQGHISEATLAMKSGDKGFIKKELDDQLTEYKQFADSGSSGKAKLKCANVTAALLTETAMAWHLEAVGSGGVRGTGDEETMTLAAQIYQNVVDNFTQAQFEKFEFPRIIKEDWPNIFKIKYAMADLLYFQKDWEKCGPAFDSVVEENPNGPEAPEAAYAAVLCYQKMYLAKHEDGSDKKGMGNLPSGASGDESSAADKAKYAPKEMSDSQQGMITAFNRFVCYIKPKEGDKESYENFVDVKYARARTYFESQHWEEAALGFKDIALNHSDHDAGIFAAQLYLESMNVLGTHSEPARPSCYADMANDVPKFIEAYCTGGKEKENEDQCAILFRIQRDIERLAAEKLVEAADKGGADAIKQYREAGDRYLDMWEKYSEKPCENGNKESCEGAEEVLFNAAQAYQAGRLIAKAIAVRKILINPKYNLHQTEPAQRAVYQIGGNYQAIAVYDEAAKWYERFAEENPKMEEAPTALMDATVLRLGLGQEDQAIKNADLFNRNYGARKAEESAQINFAIGAHYVDKEDWPNARKRLQSSIGQIDRNASLDVQIQAHALLGRVNARSKSDAGARMEYQKVRGYWTNPGATVDKLNAIGGSQPEKDRRLGKVLEAVGEAYFYFAEQERKKVDAIKFPEYNGSGDRDDVLNHINTKVADWVKRKRPAIEAAEAEYLKILDLKPVPPPRWVIAAGARAGQMWGKFVAEFRAAPIPSEWEGDGFVPGTDLSYAEIRGVYFQRLDEASEPQKQRAKGAFQKCLGISVQYQFFDEYSRSCEEWLARNYPAEFSAIDEWRTTPNRVGSGLNDRGQPLKMDGTPFVPVPTESLEAKPKEGDEQALFQRDDLDPNHNPALDALIAAEQVARAKAPGVVQSPAVGAGG